MLSVHGLAVCFIVRLRWHTRAISQGWCALPNMSWPLYPQPALHSFLTQRCGHHHGPEPL